MATATDRVFGTAELVEAILLSVHDGDRNNLFDVLRATRVNRFFKATIDGSPKLQRALFYQTNPSGKCGQWNPIVANLDMMCIPSIHIPKLPDTSTAYRFTLYAPPGHDPSSHYWAVFDFEDFNPPPFIAGSWLQMRLANFDVRVRRVTVLFGEPERRWKIQRWCDLKNPSLGDMLDLTRKINSVPCSRCPRCVDLGCHEDIDQSDTGNYMRGFEGRAWRSEKDAEYRLRMGYDGDSDVESSDDSEEMNMHGRDDDEDFEEDEEDQAV